MTWRVFKTALACAALSAASAAIAQTAPVEALSAPTAADLGALPILTGPAMSPDGNHIAARGLLGGQQMVLIVDISTPERKLRKLNLPAKHQLEWVRWAGNDRILASLSKLDRVMGEEVRVTRLAMLDIASGKQMIVGPREQGVDGDDIVHVDRDGKYVLLSTQPSIFEWPQVFRVELDTGKSRRIVDAQEGVWEWFADSSGVVRAGLGVEGTRWWLTYRPSEAQGFKRILRRDASKENEKDKDNGIQQFVPVFASDKGYAVANGKNGHFALYRYDFSADQLGELLYENPTVDLDSFTVGDDGQLIGVSYVDDRSEIAWFDPELKKVQARIDRALPSTINRVVSMSTNKMRLLVWSGGAADPGAYYVYDRTANQMNALAQPYDSMRGKLLSEMASVRYKARDGLEIRAYLTLPPGKADAKGLPLVVMPHGGPFARDEWAYDPWVQYLATKGYAVLQPNFRGSTGFGRAFVEKGSGAWGRGMQDDIDDGVKWLAAQGTADPKRVCIMGASFGGYAAMWAAVRNPETYRCAISFAGISDVASMLRYDRKSFAATRYFRNWRERVQGDKSFELDQISPIKSIEKMTVPILIAHGSEDDNVPLYQSRRLHEALLKLKREHEYVVYEGEGHGFKEPKNSTDFLTRVGKFLDKHNPAEK